MKMGSGATARVFPWHLIAEGGKHAVYAFSGESDADADDSIGDDPSFLGNVLRVCKSDLCLAAAAAAASKQMDPPFAASIAKQIDGAKRIPSNRLKNRISGHTELVRRHIGPQYLDSPQLVTLNGAFASELWRVAIKSGRIPENRMPDWDLSIIQNTSFDEKMTINKMQICGTLLKDHTSIRLKGVPAAPNDTISIEIKPKAGYLPCSPLIHPNRRKIKMQNTRYRINQLLQVEGHLKRGWGNIGDSCSSYNPLDLFSADAERMKRALQCLVDNPQNNIKIWHGGSLIVGHNAPSLDEELSIALLQGIFPHLFEGDQVISRGGASYEILINLIIETLASILTHEPLLSRIKSAQLLDVIDVDGAIVIWNYLKTLCEGNVDEVVALIDACEIADIDGKEVDYQWKSPYVLPESHSSLDALKEKLSSFTKFTKPLQDRTESISDEDLEVNYQEVNYQEALDIVDDMSKEEAALLLAEWLFSLSICDLSLFVTFHPIFPMAKGKSGSDIAVDDFELQADGNAGQFTMHSDYKSLRFGYEVKIVDCGVKPAKKLEKREESENLIDRLNK